MENETKSSNLNDKKLFQSQNKAKPRPPLKRPLYNRQHIPRPNIKVEKINENYELKRRKMKQNS